MTPEQATLAAMKPSKGLANMLRRAGYEVPLNQLETIRLAREVIGSTRAVSWVDSFKAAGRTTLADK